MFKLNQELSSIVDVLCYFEKVTFRSLIRVIVAVRTDKSISFLGINHSVMTVCRLSSPRILSASEFKCVEIYFITLHHVENV